MLNVDQLRELIIKPALSKLHAYSEVASELLVFTCAVESEGGTYVKQIKGPALGIYQMEPKTYYDIWQKFIRNKSNMLMLMTTNFLCPRVPPEERLIYDLEFATAMGRIHYQRIQEALPKSADPEVLWEYYKQYWNTPEGSAKKDKSLKAYENFIRLGKPIRNVSESVS